MSSHRDELEWFDSTLHTAKGLQRDIQRISRRIRPTRPDLHLSFFLFSKVLKSVSAIRLLWGSDFFQDALVLSRCVFEASVLDAYIRSDRTSLAKRYLAYEEAARHGMSVGMIRSMKNRRGKDWRAWKGAAAKHGRAVKGSAYGFYEPGGWSGKSLREIVRRLEKNGAEGIWTAYEFFYGLGSAVAHSSAQSMQEYMRRPHGTSYGQFGQRRAYLRDLPMLVCKWCMITGLSSAQDHFHLDTTFVPGDALVRAYHLLRSLIDALGDDLTDFDLKFFR